MFQLVFVHGLFEQIIGRSNRDFVAEAFKTEGFHHQKMKMKMLIQLAIAPTVPLFEGKHPNQDTDGCIGTAFSFAIKVFKTLFIDLANDMMKKLIMPVMRIIKGFSPFLVQLTGNVTHKIDLTIGRRFFKHPRAVIVDGVKVLIILNNYILST